MTPIERWLERRRRKDEKLPRFDDALLSDRAWAYARYRLRYVLWRVILRSGLHLLEVLLLSRVFPMEFLAPVLVVRSGTAMGLGFWWGALEQLRWRVRRLGETKTWHEIRRTIDGWLLLSIAIGVAVVGGGAGWLLTHPDPMLGFSIFDTYAIGCLLRLALDLYTRTYHSGMFALRRIYRPLWSLMVSDVLDVLGVLLLWPFLGPWSFGIVLAGVGVVRTVITVLYVRRMYRLSDVPPQTLREFVLRAWRGLHLSDFPALVKHGLANLTTQLDSLLIVTLVAAHRSGEGYFDLAIVFYLLRPFITSGFAWTRLFYFDFKTLEQRYSRFFKARFERFLKWVALAFALVLGALGFGWLWLFWRENLDPSLLLLLAFLLARSFFGLYQIQAFSYGNYRYLVKVGAVLGLGILTLGFLPQDNFIVIASITALLALVVVIGGSPRERKAPAPSDRARTIPLPEWLTEICTIDRPIRVSMALVNARLGSPPLVTERIAGELRGGALARFGQRIMIWYEPADVDLITRDRAVVATGGCLRDLEIGAPAADGPAALTRTLAELSLAKELARRLTPDPALPAPENLAAEFARCIPEGTLLDMQRGRIALRKAGLAARHLRHLLLDIGRLARGAPIRGAIPGSLDLALYWPRGEPQTLFVYPRTVDAAQRVRWRLAINRLTLQQSLDPSVRATVVPPATAPPGSAPAGR